MNYATIHVPNNDARRIIENAGWTVHRKFSAELGREVFQYVRPGKKPREEGGRFGDDFLWHLEEALYNVVTGEDR